MNDASKLELVWLEFDLDDVIRHYAEGLRPAEGKITRFEFLIDPHLRKVLFKIYLEHKEPKK